MKGGLSEFQAEVSGFSGPFDLLCYLVENGSLEAAGISVGQAVKIYGAYLANTRHVSVDVVSEFLAMAASLVLSKIKSLIPGVSAPRGEAPEPDEGAAPAESMEGQLSRYRPYRKAASFLMGKKEGQDMRFLRSCAYEGPQTWDLGDLYGLCTIWWDLLGERQERPVTGLREDLPWDGEWDGAPLPLPDEEQIELKMEEIREILRGAPRIAFSTLLGNRGALRVFIVTLLALLELSRRGAVRIAQEELFGDVLVFDAQNLY